MIKDCIEEKLDTYFGKCKNIKACVSEGTTNAKVLKGLIPEPSIKEVPPGSLFQSLIDNECSIIFAGVPVIPKGVVSACVIKETSIKSPTYFVVLLNVDSSL